MNNEKETINKFYITTTLPYANAVPHVGHAIEFFQADAYARYFRRKVGNENVFFNVGIDEHGLKVFTTAKELGTTPEKFLDDLAPQWIDFCSKFRISHNYFYRTSSKDHHSGAQRIWQICNSKGDIYKKRYEGFYCVGCEAFLHERDGNLMQTASELYEPIIPDGARTAIEAIHKGEKIILYPRI